MHALAKLIGGAASERPWSVPEQLATALGRPSERLEACWITQAWILDRPGRSA